MVVGQRRRPRLPPLPSIMSAISHRTNAERAREAQTEAGPSASASAGGSKTSPSKRDPKPKPAPLEPNRDPRLFVAGGDAPAVAYVAGMPTPRGPGRSRRLLLRIDSGLRALSPKRWASLRSASARPGVDGVEAGARDSVRSHLVESATTTVIGSTSPALKSK
jgi:hypothetical protein